MNHITVPLRVRRWTARGLAMLTLLTPSASRAGTPVDEPPFAFDGGPYAGTAGIAMTFNGTGSFDANGDALTYDWDFGDGSSHGSGPTPTHVYTTASTYTVRLTVTANGLSGVDETTATITNPFSARAFVLGQEVSKLSTPKPSTVRIESGGQFMLWDVIVTQVWMVSSGTGSVDAIRAIPTSVATDGDKDRNGVAELKASFAKADLRKLFSTFTGRTAPVTIRGQVTSGAWFSTTLQFPLDGSTGTVASLTNNPGTGEATLELAPTEHPVQIAVFDLQGRVLRSWTVDGRSLQLIDLASAARERGGATTGIYFYRVHDGAQSHQGRFVLLN